MIQYVEYYWYVIWVQNIRNNDHDIQHGSISRRVLMSGALRCRNFGRGDPLSWSRDILYPQMLALTSPTGGCRSVGRVRLQTEVTEFVLLFYIK
jgi:hypothetical protein